MNLSKQILALKKSFWNPIKSTVHQNSSNDLLGRLRNVMLQAIGFAFSIVLPNLFFDGFGL